ncbi:hypothetical protein U9M48_035060 [Paspalum notatum var. saurae]|uniref:Uncharacterized protein n=1 Tax=Paspalum notatum var. saurae TaxID=547442 RepID=A0AAQ3UBR3_PASNO
MQYLTKPRLPARALGRIRPETFRGLRPKNTLAIFLSRVSPRPRPSKQAASPSARRSLAASSSSPPPLASRLPALAPAPSAGSSLLTLAVDCPRSSTWAAALLIISPPTSLHQVCLLPISNLKSPPNSKPR